MKKNRVTITSAFIGAALLQACATPPAGTVAGPSITLLKSQCEVLVGSASQASEHPPGSTQVPAGRPLQPHDSADSLTWISLARRAADQLACSIPTQYRGEGPILLATLVDLNSLKSEAQFGRVMTEQVGNRLARLGYPVMEMRLRDAISIQDQIGELMLSRQVQDLAKAHKTPLAIVGTYTETISRTVVNLRAVRVTDGVVISSADFTVVNDADVQNMLTTKSGVTKEAREAARPLKVREFQVRP